MEVESDLNSITDEDQLRKMWLQTEDFRRKKEIRTHLYKLREARLRDFYNTDQVDASISSSVPATPVNLTNITKNKFPFKSHGDSILDHTYQSYKTKEIRDSVSPTHEINCSRGDIRHDSVDSACVGNIATIADTDTSGWNIQKSSETSQDGKTHKNELIATTEDVAYTTEEPSTFENEDTDFIEETIEIKSTKKEPSSNIKKNISKGLVSSRKNIFENSKKSTTTVMNSRETSTEEEPKSKVSLLKHSYMSHTISSMEHRRDSLELAKTSYGQKPKVQDEPFEESETSAVKFNISPKTPTKYIRESEESVESTKRKDSRELLLPRTNNQESTYETTTEKVFDVLDSTTLEEVGSNRRKSSVEIEEIIPTKFGVDLKRKITPPKQRKTSSPEIPHIEEVFDLIILEEMLKNATAYEQRRRIRAQIRLVKKSHSTIKTTGKSEQVRSIRKVDSAPKGSSRTTTATTTKVAENGAKVTTKTTATTTTSEDKGTKTTTKTMTTTTNTNRKVDDGPIWTRQNILKKANTNESPVKNFKPVASRDVGATKTKSTSTTTSADCCITSSYGIGPTDEAGKPLFGIRALKYKKSAGTSEDFGLEGSTTTKSFVNESSREITGVNDVICRMKNADKVEEDGDTEEDREARALLNKFIGANILMSSIETVVPPNRGNKNQINCTTTTTTLTKKSTATLEEKPTDDNTKPLEEEEPLEVINFLKQIMAGREETEVVESAVAEEEYSEDSSSASSSPAQEDEQDAPSDTQATEGEKQSNEKSENKVDEAKSSSDIVEKSIKNLKVVDGELEKTKCSIKIDECTEEDKDMLSTTINSNNLKTTNAEKYSIEDSGTESSEDLRVLAADLREKIQMHSSGNQKGTDIISEVAEALSKLENSLKDGEDINLNRGKRNALLTLVANLQNHLLSSEDNSNSNNSPPQETSSPEYDAVRSNRHRFARKRNRANRHTVGVSREELADARKYIEDLVLMESLSNPHTPESTTPVSPVQPKRYSLGDALEEFQPPSYFVKVHENNLNSSLKMSKSTPKLATTIDSVGKENSKVLLRVNSSSSIGPKVRPLSDSFPEKSVASAYESAIEQNKIYASQNVPENSRFSRFSNKKQMMKRANTIDIPKTRHFRTDSDSETDEKGLGLLRAVQVSVKQRPKNVVPEFVPKTENDHKFMAFLQKQTHSHGLGWNNNKSVTNWTNKFGNIKNAFESGAVVEKTTISKPPIPPQPSKLMSKSPQTHILSPPIIAPNPVVIPRPVPINQFIHASKSVFKPVRPDIPNPMPPQIQAQFQPIRNEPEIICPSAPNHNSSKWGGNISSASSPSGFSTHSQQKWGPNLSTPSSPNGLPWTVRPPHNSVMKIAASKFENPEPVEYKPLNRHNSMRSLKNAWQAKGIEQDYNKILQKRPSLPDSFEPNVVSSTFHYAQPIPQNVPQNETRSFQAPYIQRDAFKSQPNIQVPYNESTDFEMHYQNSLTNPNLQPLVLTNNNPIYYPQNDVSHKSPLPPRSPALSDFKNHKNYLSLDDNLMEYKAESKVMKSPISHQAVKIDNRVNQRGDDYREKNSEAAKSLLSVMKNVGQLGVEPRMVREKISGEVEAFNNSQYPQYEAKIPKSVNINYEQQNRVYNDYPIPQPIDDSYLRQPPQLNYQRQQPPVRHFDEHEIATDYRRQEPHREIYQEKSYYTAEPTYEQSHQLYQKEIPRNRIRDVGVPERTIPQPTHPEDDEYLRRALQTQYYRDEDQGLYDAHSAQRNAYRDVGVPERTIPKTNYENRVSKEISPNLSLQYQQNSGIQYQQTQQFRNQQSVVKNNQAVGYYSNVTENPIQNIPKQQIEMPPKLVNGGYVQENYAHQINFSIPQYVAKSPVIVEFPAVQQKKVSKSEVASKPSSIIPQAVIKPKQEVKKDVIVPHPIQYPNIAPKPQIPKQKEVTEKIKQESSAPQKMIRLNSLDNDVLRNAPKEDISFKSNPLYCSAQTEIKRNVVYNNVTQKVTAPKPILQKTTVETVETESEIVKSSLENNMVFKKFGPPQRHCYMPNSYQTPSSSTSNLSIIRRGSGSNVPKITAQFSQEYTKQPLMENPLRRTKSGHTLALPKMYEGSIKKTELVQKQKTVAAYFTGQKSPVDMSKSEIQTESSKSASSRRFAHKVRGGLSRSQTMPQLNDLNLLDESNIEDAFEQLITTAKI